MNQAVAASLLRSQGHTVVIAGDGSEALAALDRETFDLILMDVQMPGMDGFQATPKIPEAESSGDVRIPIVALTAHAMSGDREKCIAAGMDEYLSKPVSRAALKAVIDRVMAARGSQPRFSMARQPCSPSHADRARTF